MQFRHEWKHEINAVDRLVLLTRLNAVMKRDPHAVDWVYRIRSLYFDTFSDRALREKIDGVNIREKFRIRFYDGDLSYICLEKKSKRDGLGNKRQARITAEEAAQIAAGILPAAAQQHDRSDRSRQTLHRRLPESSCSSSRMRLAHSD
jgi:hypothetical protein